MPSELLTHAPRGAAGVVSAVMLAGVAMWGIGVPSSQIGATTVLAANNAPHVIDMSTSTVQEVLANEPDTDRFYLLLIDTGVFSQLNGSGPYTVYAPENNAIDYLPRAQYVELSADQKKALAEAHIGKVPLPAGVQILKEYQTSNGVIYIINQVLPVRDQEQPGS